MEFSILINFNNMPTILLRHQLNARNSREQQLESQRDPVALHIEDKARPLLSHQPSKVNALHRMLPPIHQTELLISRPRQTGLFFAQEREGSQPSKIRVRRMTQFRPKYPLNEKVNDKGKDKENCSRIQTEQDGRMHSISKVCHNFINKKKDKQANYMHRVIEKVVSEDIEPWNIEHSQVRSKGRFHYRAERERKSREGESRESAEWEREILGNCNFGVGPF